MTLEEVKINWNKGLTRFKKAEILAEKEPVRFEKYIRNFNEIVKEMSNLMQQYKSATGEDIPEHEFNNGFNLKN